MVVAGLFIKNVCPSNGPLRNLIEAKAAGSSVFTYDSVQMTILSPHTPAPGAALLSRTVHHSPSEERLMSARTLCYRRCREQQLSRPRLPTSLWPSLSGSTHGLLS